MAIDSGSAKMSDASLTSLVGILSIPGAFLEFRDFRMVSISLGVILEPIWRDVEEWNWIVNFCFYGFLRY